MIYINSNKLNIEKTHMTKKNSSKIYSVQEKSYNIDREHKICPLKPTRTLLQPADAIQIPKQINSKGKLSGLIWLEIFM